MQAAGLSQIGCKIYERRTAKFEYFKYSNFPNLLKKF